MTALRRAQAKSYWADETPSSAFRRAFNLPDDQEELSTVHAVLSLQGQDEAYSGKLYLSQARVEKVGTSHHAAAFALSLTLLHGLRIVVQLNSLRTTNDQFCSVLRTQLKAALPLMKALKPFQTTFFSEWFLSPDRDDEVAAAEAKKLEADKVKTGQLVSIFDDAATSDEKAAMVDESVEWTTEAGTSDKYHGGLGLIFKYPGDPRKLREKSKMKLWKEYLRQHGRNITLVRYPTFNRLVQVGLPNRLRGEVWELSCGSVFLRMANPGVYAQILKDHEGRTSASTEDIEKDLHRSLPEYAAYQDDRGIDTMRRVLTAYSWANPAVGYCQAMNLVVASFLIYMSEEQCFWCLSVLCDRLLPGYYSPSMYGTVLDQRVFERLVERCLPTLHEHFAQYDIQLSVASLPWFLSCFISSMPMVFAFRILDCFFLMGPKVLFQVSLAILKINGEKLLEATDDGAFINIMKRYFGSLGQTAHPNAADPRIRSVTFFQELLVIAFREFSIITDETIASERKRFRAEVVVSIEEFAKRSTLRNLKRVGRLDKRALGLVYDHHQLAVLKNRQDAAAAVMKGRDRSTSSAVPAPGKIQAEAATALGPVAEPRVDKAESRIDRRTFGTLISGIATWARNEKVVRNGFHEHVERTPVEHDFIDRIFSAWDVSQSGALSFQDIVDGLDSVLYNDLMSNLAWIFNIHDKDRDGYLTKDEVLQLSESLLFIFRNEPGDLYLGSVSNLMQNLFEAAETTKPPEETQPATPPATEPSSDASATSTGRHRRTPSIVAENPHRPYLGLSTFRMCILADPLLEEFFASDLTQSWKLEILIAEEKPKPQGAVGWLGGIVSAVMTDENKERLNRLADQVGKRLDIQQVEQRPSIGKLSAERAAMEPVARDSLFSTAKRPAPAVRPSPETLDPLSAAAMRMDAYPSPVASSRTQESYPTDNPWADVPSSKADIDMLAVAGALERPQFVLDDSTDADDDEFEEGEGEAGGEGDAELLAQVDTFLAEDDGAATGKTTAVNEDLLKEENGASLI